MSEWIPATERMPEEHDECIIHTIEWDDDDVSEDVLIILDSGDGKRRVIKSRTRNGKLEVELFKGWKIIALMPLPEPYKEEVNEDVW